MYEGSEDSTGFHGNYWNIYQFCPGHVGFMWDFTRLMGFRRNIWGIIQGISLAECHSTQRMNSPRSPWNDANYLVVFVRMCWLLDTLYEYNIRIVNMYIYKYIYICIIKYIILYYIISYHIILYYIILYVYIYTHM